MATTFQELQTKHDEVAKLVEGDPVQSGQVGRVKRNMEVFTELEKIKQAAGADKEKYMKDVVAEAKTLVEANKDALLKLSDLRKDSVANASEIAKLFSDNKDLIKARAYLVLGVGLSSVKPDSEEAKFFAQFLVDGKDADFSTNSLIEKVKLSAADAQKTADQLHEDCLNAAADEISRVLEYLKSVKDRASKAKEAEATGKGATSNEPGKENTGNTKPAEVNQALFEKAFGVNIDKSGRITKVVDADLASKRLGGPVHEEDQISRIWVIAEKYSSNRGSEDAIDAAGFESILRSTKGLSEIGLVVRAGGVERRLFTTPGDLTEAMEGSSSNPSAGPQQEELSDLAKMVKSDTTPSFTDRVGAERANLRRTFLDQFYALCPTPKPATIFDAVVAFEKEMKASYESNEKVSREVEQRRKRQGELLGEYEALYNEHKAATIRANGRF